MDALYKEIGQRMRAIRKTLRLTQAQLAESAGIDASFYGQIERGMNIPSIKTLLAIAKALKVDPALLLPGRKEKEAGLYQTVIERLVGDLNPKKKRQILGMVSDIVGRLKE